MISKKRIFTYTLFSLTTITASIVVFKSMTCKTENVVSVVEKIQKCSPFATLLTTPNQHVDCPLGFLETQETEHGTILVICHCQDPLRCADK